jgi:hypothetical protein
MKPTLLILAAGLGSRYGGVKQMDKIGPSGESIIDYSIYDAIRAGFGKVVFVINKNIEKDFIEIFEPKLKGKIETAYVLQEIKKLPDGFVCPADRVKPWGTAHAILAAKDVINEPFAVINADDFYGANAYKTVVDYFGEIGPNSTDYCMVGYQLGNTITEHGSVSRGVCIVDEGNFLTRVDERTSIKKVQNEIGFYENEAKWIKLNPNTPVSMNIWGFTAGFFGFLEKGFIEFLKDNVEVDKSEYFIPLEVTNLINRKQARVKVLESDAKWFGVTYKEDKAFVIDSINKLVDQNIYPNNLWE